MRARTAVAAAAAIVALAATQAGAAPVADGKIAGRVASALRPAPGSQTVVSAIDASNLTVAASGATTRAGAYRLSVPPGVFLVSAEKLGRGAAPARGFSRLVRVQGGKTSRPPAITRRPQVDGKATLYGGKKVLAVKEFSATGPFRHFGRGLASMVEGDIVGDPCVVVVEWMRRADVLAEIKLQQSKLVDPSTRVTPRLIQPDIFVEGSVSTTSAALSWSIRMRDIKSGRIVARDSGSVPWAGAFDVSKEIAERLLEQLGAHCLPPSFEGTFSGELKVAATTTFTGKIRFERIEGPASTGVATYRVAKVEFTTTFDAAPACQGRATEKVTLARPDPNVSKLVIETRRTAGKGFRYFIVSMFQSPRQRQITITCNGTPVTTPWVPAAALNTGSNQYTDGVELTGKNDELKPNVYVWALRGEP